MFAGHHGEAIRKEGGGGENLHSQNRSQHHMATINVKDNCSPRVY